MRFKRQWRYLYGGLFVCIFYTFGPLLEILYGSFFLLRNRYYKDFFFILLFFLGLICMAVSVVSLLWENFTDIIILDDIGITFQRRKKPSRQIRWEEISRIIRIKRPYGKALVFLGAYDGTNNDEIWFHYNEKIEDYILSNHPELQPLFPDKKDFRKWLVHR